MLQLRYVTVKKAADLTGYTERAIAEKIRSGVWAEGVVWLKAPDGKRLIDLQGYEAWAESEYDPRARQASKSASCIKGNKGGKGSPLSPPPLI